MLLLGGSAVINALTGMNIYAAAFLIPIGVILYTAVGGLKATFMSSYIHTVRPLITSHICRQRVKLPFERLCPTRWRSHEQYNFRPVGPPAQC